MHCRKLQKVSPGISNSKAYLMFSFFFFLHYWYLHLQLQKIIGSKSLQLIFWIEFYSTKLKSTWNVELRNYFKTIENVLICVRMQSSIVIVGLALVCKDWVYIQTQICIECRAQLQCITSSSYWNGSKNDFENDGEINWQNLHLINGPN